MNVREALETLEQAEIDTPELADMTRRESARLLRLVAAQLEGETNYDTVEALLFEAVTYMGTAERLDRIWAKTNPDDSDLVQDFSKEMRRARRATEATPHTTQPASALRVADSST